MSILTVPITDMTQLPTIKQLRYYTMLVKHQHFGRAASACFVSQSAFSVSIKGLENLLGVQLVDRTSKQVTITEIGEEFASGARRILEQLENLVETTPGHQAPLHGKLRLGVIPTIAPFVVPRILGPLRQHYPNLKLYLVEDKTQLLYEKLMAGDIDIILLALPYDMRGVETRNLFRDAFYLAHRDDTELLDIRNYQIDNLPEDSILLLEDGHCLRDHAISACNLKNQNTIARFSASSLFTLIQMVDEDLGITYLPEMALGSSLLSQTHVKTQKLEDESCREIGLAWRQNSARKEDFELLGEFISNHRTTKQGSN